METPKKTVLIIEDDPRLAGLLRSLLISRGYKVICKETGMTGHAEALNSHPDIILLDVMLPDISGMIILNRLRQDDWGKSAKIIILTNLTPDETIMQGIIADEPSLFLIKAETPIEKIIQHVVDIVGE